MATTLTLEQDALSETYDDLKLLIYKVTHSFSARYNIPFEELLSEAHLSYVRAYKNYRPDRFKKKASFSSLVYFALTCDLTTYLKKHFKHSNHCELREELCGTEDHDSFLLQLEGELSSDAASIVRLIVETPDDINTLFRWNNVHGKRGCLQALREHLEDIGWTRREMAKCFEEISLVLGVKRTENKEVKEDRVLERVGLRRTDVIRLSRKEFAAKQINQAVA